MRSEASGNAAVAVVQDPESIPPTEAVTRHGDSVNMKLGLDKFDSARDLRVRNLRAMAVEEFGDIEAGGAIDVLRSRLAIK